MTPIRTDPAEPGPVVRRSTPALGAAAALAEHLDRLLAVRAEGLAPLVAWEAGSAPVVVHEVPAGAVPLASLRDVGPLRSAHVLRVATSVCSALVGLHAAGLAHGAVDAEHVLVGPDGEAVLAAAGASWPNAPGSPLGPRPADDIAALGELVRMLLGQGAAPGTLIVAALRAADPDPAMRPDAHVLLGLLRSCGRSEPLLGPLWGSPAGAGPDDAPPPPASAAARTPAPAGSAPRPGARTSRRPRRPARRRPDDAAGPVPAAPEPAAADLLADPPVGPRPGRRQRAAAPARRRLPLVVTSVAAMMVGALAFRAAPLLGAAAETPPLPAASSASAVATPAGPLQTDAFALDPAARTDWAAVLAELDAGRRAALAGGSEAQLARWVDPQGTAWHDDVALLRRLAAADAQLHGGALVLESVELQRADARAAVLRVRDRREAYVVVVDGRTQHVAERTAARWTVTLSRDDGGTWRISGVAPA